MADDVAIGRTPTTRTGLSLDRRLGPLDAAAIVVSNVIGGGIFFVPILVAGMVPDAGAILAVWLAGGLLAFTGAMAYAELAAVRPQAGGEYVYLREAFGRPAAFLTGWTSFVAGFTGAIAASAVALADYVGRFVPAAADASPLFSIPVPGLPLVVSPRAVVALTAIGALSWVHLRGLGPGRPAHRPGDGGESQQIRGLEGRGLDDGSSKGAGAAGFRRPDRARRGPP